MSTNAPKAVIRPMTIADLDQVMMIENEAFIAPWTREQFVYELTENSFATATVLTISETIVGFADFWITFDSGTINQIAIRHELRKFGLGLLLLQDTLKRLAAVEGFQSVTLEVRTHNQAAIRLYEKAGFVINRVKKAYYDNGDDAYYMIKKV